MLLREVANRIDKSTRQTDTVARYAGDEFLVVLEAVGDVEQTTRIAEKILSVVSMPFLLGKHTISYHREYWDCTFQSRQIKHYAGYRFNQNGGIVPCMLPKRMGKTEFTLSINKLSKSLLVSSSCNRSIH